MHPKRHLYLVACVSKKQAVPLPAHELYCSVWFKKACTYVKQKQAPWFILSAKYGLLEPTRVIQPYDKTLIKMSVNERRKWATRVAKGLSQICQKGDRITILAGKLYRVDLIPYLKAMDCKVEIPMFGLSIGKQLQWLTRKAHKSRL